MRAWILVWMSFSIHFVSAQLLIRGKVTDAENMRPIAGASVEARSGTKTITDGDGKFSISLLQKDTLQINHLSYSPQKVFSGNGSVFLDIRLVLKSGELEVVEVSTGYYKVPKERSSGSFSVIDDKALSRAISGDILSRINGMATGVQFVNRASANPSDIRVRGLSTIESDESPLIILDGFPYEGNMANLDPNDIESITVLKDAAAASIWGAKAGNGVIVLTSKKARAGRINANLNISRNVSDKPDLFYSRSWLPSEIVMDIEKQRFALGHYRFADNIANPYYVELLEANRKGNLTDADLTAQEQLLRTIDIREQASRYLYRHPTFTQYALNLNGGSEQYRFTFTSGYHTAKGDRVGDDSRRLNIGLRNTIRLSKHLGFDLGAAYVSAGNRANGIGYGDLNVSGVGVSPYLRLMDPDGTPAAIPRGNIGYQYAVLAESAGLLDWMYRPLQERDLLDRRTDRSELRLNLGLDVRILESLKWHASYQLTQGQDQGSTLYRKDSYYVRDIVNRFTQQNNSRIIPHNAILETGAPTVSLTHYGRAQVGYEKQFAARHDVSLLGGVDIRSGRSQRKPGSILYNYNDEYHTGSNVFDYLEFYEMRPSGRGQIPSASAVSNHFVNRDLSYFSNGSYTYDNRYILNGSLRWDGSNLFGVKANQKGVPLWSLGGSWNLSNERFYKIRVLPYLRLRATHGVAGNVNKYVTHFPTIRYSTAATQLDMATLTSVGNPALRWERVTTSNLGLDFSMFGGRLAGSIDNYRKKGDDLIGNNFMDPTSGIRGDYKINYANIETEGWDLQLSSTNRIGDVDWNITLLSSWVKNKVTHFNSNEIRNISPYLSGTAPPMIGRSRDQVYAIPWHGLAADNGQPIIYMDGERSNAYSTYYNIYMDYEKLLPVGSSVPLNYGSFRNIITWHGLELGVMLSWKRDYVFRRSSIGPFDEFNRIYHQDYYNRWKMPGDEQSTTIPAFLPIEEMAGENLGISSVYKYSEVLITSGDHIRLQEINFRYQIPFALAKRLYLNSFSVIGYARDLGVIWRANSHGIDPDYANDLFPASRQFSLGVQLNF